jgi:hypothetical protein
VTTVTGACAGGSDAQALRTSMAPLASEYRKCMVSIPPAKMPINEEKRNYTPSIGLAPSSWPVVDAP